MDSTEQLNIANSEVNPHEFGFDFYHEDPFEKILELPPLDSTLFEFENFNLQQLPYQSNSIELSDFENVSGDFFLLDNSISSLYEDMVIDVKPLNQMNMVGSFGHFALNKARSEDIKMVQREDAFSSEKGVQEERMIIWRGSDDDNVRRKRSSGVNLEMEEIQKYFGVPITRAAKEMKVGLTVLKKRCRELNIMRWPHRKIKSLKSLIDNVKELGLSDEIMMLEEHRRLLETMPDMELTDRTKKLRQACFKANYKKRRSLAANTIF